MMRSSLPSRSAIPKSRVRRLGRPFTEDKYLTFVRDRAD